jgi:Fe2+ or Zn2+ uptake regulation protein
MSFIDDAATAIHESGGRFTAQRRLIIEVLEEAGGHLDAVKLYQLAHDRDDSISLATVYRTLNVLTEAGLIRERYLTRGHDRLVYETGGIEHYHFTCSACHRVIEFETHRVEQIKQALEVAFGVQVNHTCLCLEGVCYACQQEQEAGQRAASKADN